MTDPIPPPLPPPSLQHRSLLKHRSWSPDTEREEAWQRRKDLHRARRNSGHLALSVTEDDFDELRGCLDLGIDFGDGSRGGSSCSKRLAEVLPALDLYWSVRKALHEEKASDCSSASESSFSEGSPDGSPLSMFDSGNNPAEMKETLKRWAKVVAFAVRQR
ncbi:hypothetical protein HPP92_015774 [Vanilla planifolia]|uniref:Uncharacterized protein n=1 Tax=Vanilla planifolia TaxID=51239 RepID=A0A835UQ23_VANPL|nr:hypothetical protein HPP92_016388 [Vanilla planifolia]KAG0471228.1 hypothetical protein HPP92_015774 [Vanilla planifolia]